MDSIRTLPWSLVLRVWDMLFAESQYYNTIIMYTSSYALLLSLKIVNVLWCRIMFFS